MTAKEQGLLRECFSCGTIHGGALCCGPIERDPKMERDYIPMPGGWEIQTKGRGSTFRICDKDGDRLAIPDSPYLHETLERMARDVNAAALASDTGERGVGDRDREDLRFLIAFTIPHPIREFVLSNLVDRGWLTDGGNRGNPCVLTKEGAVLVEAALRAQPQPVEGGESAEPPSDEVWPPDGAIWLAPVATDAPANPKLMQYAWGRSSLSSGQMAEAYQCIVSAAQECGQVYRLPVATPPESGGQGEAFEGDSGVVAFAMAVPSEVMAALRRFAETAEDDESYDVPKEMMSRLAMFGLVTRGRPGWYYLTDFGRAALAQGGGNER